MLLLEQQQLLPPAQPVSSMARKALLGFCKANALGYPEERTSLMAGKTAFENHWPSQRR
jgi:hypothetical protein